MTRTHLGITADYQGTDRMHFGKQYMNVWKVTLRYQGRQLTTRYYMGTGLVGEPEARDVVASLIHDAQAYEDSTGLYDFAENFGYGTPETTSYVEWREVERIYEACKQTVDRVRRLLGSDYQEWADYIDAEGL